MSWHFSLAQLQLVNHKTLSWTPQDILHRNTLQYNNVEQHVVLAVASNYVTGEDIRSKFGWTWNPSLEIWYFLRGLIHFSHTIPEFQSISCNVRGCVCLFEPLTRNHDSVDWRLLVRNVSFCTLFLLIFLSFLYQFYYPYPMRYSLSSISRISNKSFVTSCWILWQVIGWT